MERPSNVPAAATFDADDDEWMLAERDEEGREHGLTTWWRADGSRCCVTEYVHGTPHGRFERFHDNGETSRSGRFVEGQLHGTNTFLRSTAPTRETFPAGLADAVWRCEMDYERGRVGEARAYDQSGHRVLEDGAPYPTEQPAGVPTSAHFRQEEDGWRWVQGTVEDKGDGTIDRQGTWRWWSPEGDLVLERTYVDGALHGEQRVYEDGVVVALSTFADGDETGPFERRAEAGRYRLDVHTERGTLDDGNVVGSLQLLDDDGTVLATVDMGRKPSQDVLVEVIQGAHGDDDLRRLETDLPSAAFLGAVHGGRPVAELTRRLSAMQPPLSAEAMAHETQMAQHVVHNVMRFGGGPLAVIASLLDGIRKGADAGDLLRHGAATLDDMGHGPVAALWIDAACAIDADFVGHEYTRALIRMSLGEPEAAMASIERLATGMEGPAAQMRAYHAGVFHSLSMDVASDPRLALAETLAPLLASAVQADVPDAEVVRRQLQQLATRLQHAREGVVTYFEEEPAWAPPTLDHLLPDGPVEVELPDAHAIGWMHEARKDVLRLRWLCWSLGLDGTLLPEAVALDTARPSRALTLVVVARAQVLNGQEPDVSDWLDAESEDVDAVHDALQSGLATQSWYGLPLSELDGGTRNFAFQDEHALFDLMYRHWAAPHTVFEA